MSRQAAKAGLNDSRLKHSSLNTGRSTDSEKQQQQQQQHKQMSPSHLFLLLLHLHSVICHSIRCHKPRTSGCRGNSEVEQRGGTARWNSSHSKGSYEIG